MTTSVAFITCVNNRELYARSLASIRALNSEGFHVETITVSDSHSIAAAYNRARRLTTASYKIYLHQDVEIVNPNFLADLHRIFASEPRIGMIGMFGAKVLPPSGVWWQSRAAYGKVYHPTKSRILAAATPGGSFEAVAVVDGFLMAIRYDLSWREDIIDGFHFYDASQSLEFMRRGYWVAVPYQEKPWCFHPSPGNSSDPDFFRLRDRFLKEYMAHALAAPRFTVRKRGTPGAETGLSRPEPAGLHHPPGQPSARRRQLHSKN